MDDIVAVAIELEDGTQRYFLTWGRIQDRVNPKRLEEIVLKHSTSFRLGGAPARARLCDSLQEASQERYFYECFFEMCQKKIPYRDNYESWRRKMDKRMRQGYEISYCGIYEQ